MNLLGDLQLLCDGFTDDELTVRIRLTAGWGAHSKTSASCSHKFVYNREDEQNQQIENICNKYNCSHLSSQAVTKMVGTYAQECDEHSG